MYRIRIPIGTAMLLAVFGIGYLEFTYQITYLTTTVIGLLILAALWELYHILDKRNYNPYLYLGFFAVLVGIILQGVALQFPTLQSLKIVEFYETFILLLLFIRALLDSDKENVLERIGGTLLGFIYLYFLLTYLIRIRGLGENQHGLVYLVVLVLVAKSMDIGGYLVGKAFGKHKIAPRISPKKSWEGLFGGMALSLTSAVLLFHYLPPLNAKFCPGYALFFGFVIGILSFLGDISESLIKRRCQIKDSSNLIPEFGGILDLVDSLVFTAPWAYYFFSACLATQCH